MIESVLQVLAYSGVGLAVLTAGFVVLDLLTPGKLGHLVMEGNPGAGLVAASALVSLGLIEYFAIYFPGAAWNRLAAAARFGGAGMIAYAACLRLLHPMI